MNDKQIYNSQSGPSQVEWMLRQFHKRQSFNEVLEFVRERIDIDCFDNGYIQQAEEIALIITEILKLPDDALVKIGGYNLSADTVSTVLMRLTHENVVDVIRRFREATYEIKHVKTYLRTALYNSVFESVARVDNAVRSI